MGAQCSGRSLGGDGVGGSSHHRQPEYKQGVGRGSCSHTQREAVGMDASHLALLPLKTVDHCDGAGGCLGPGTEHPDVGLWGGFGVQV